MHGANYVREKTTRRRIRCGRPSGSTRDKSPRGTGVSITQGPTAGDLKDTRVPEDFPAGVAQ